MDLPPQIARSAIRFSLSRNTTLEEIDQTIEITAQIVSSLRRAI
jgi:cysteine sulfinate desulfinase/cysteine desulfurase-like protein